MYKVLEYRINLPKTGKINKKTHQVYIENPKRCGKNSERCRKSLQYCGKCIKIVQHNTIRYMKKIGCLFFFTFTIKILPAQTRDTTWAQLTNVETEYYQVKVPSNWLDTGFPIAPIDKGYDATGAYFPDSFNSAPILVAFFVLNQPAINLEEAKQRCISGYKTNSDRIFPEHFTTGEQKIKLASGEEAYLLNTRFFRKTKNLNQSRFDLVVFSNKAKQGYLITVSIQYNDPTYAFEEHFHLSDFANKIYNRFILK